MATTTHIQNGGARRRTALSLILLAAVALGAGASTSPQAVVDDDGRDERLRPTHRPTVEAAFASESVAPGDDARLLLFSQARGVTIQVFRTGTGGRRIPAQDVMVGTPVTQPRPIGAVRPGSVVHVRIGDWRTGLYFARLTAGPKIGYAPFVLRPRRLGEHRVAVVLATQSWQAYNFHDDDHDGRPDTWYVGGSTARLARPYENRGVPPHYNHYEYAFLHWLELTGKDVDFLADEDLREVRDGRRLAEAYDLLVFPGHHEYVTTHEYDVVTRYRDLGGNLAFLSANNFYWRISVRGRVMVKTRKWRDLGRSEAALIGVQYFGNDRGQDQRPWTIRNTAAARWLFAGTGLTAGSPFVHGGIEGDETGRSSPRGTKVLAAIPNLFGSGHDGEMTYYETPAGARVFAAGAFTLAGCSLWPESRQFMENLWSRLADG